MVPGLPPRLRPARLLPVAGLALLAGAWTAPAPPVLDRAAAPPTAGLRWWKGNTHTHTLWSDGDAAPEAVAAWYKEHGYHFLVLSDHNVLSQGERWFPVREGKASRLTPARLAELRRRFGDAVRTRETPRGLEMRLWTLPELAARFAEPGRFLFIQGEEITDAFQGRNIHVNGLHLAEPIPPQGGGSVVEVLQRDVDAVREQGRRLGRPVLAHVNHPNFTWSLTPRDVAAVRGDAFFEVYNGHSAVRNYGDAEHPGMEELWDLALVERLTGDDPHLLYGLATDDAHHYHDFGLGHPNPGRGWVMVRAPELTPEAIVSALLRGDFYASSGVTVREMACDGRRYRVAVAAEEGVRYTIRFLGTRRRPGGGLGPVGEVLQESRGATAEYRFRGDELYVRARVESSRLHPNPYAAGDREMAWLQPWRPAGKE